MITHGCFHTERFLLCFKVCPLSNYSSVLWLIFPKAGGAGSVERRVQWGRQFCWGTMEPILSQSEQRSVVTHVHLCLWCTSPTATTKQWLSITLPNIWAAVMEWSQIKCLFSSRSSCQEGRWYRTESQCFSPQHPRWSLNSMVSACRHKTCLTSEWHFTSNFILRWDTEWITPGFVNSKIKLIFLNCYFMHVGPMECVNIFTYWAKRPHLICVTENNQTSSFC